MSRAETSQWTEASSIAGDIVMGLPPRITPNHLAAASYLRMAQVSIHDRLVACALPSHVY